MNTGSARTLLALALQLAAFATLGLAVLGKPWLDERGKPRLLLLVDRSQSQPRAGSDKAVADVVQAARAAGAGEVLRLDFAGRPGPPSTSVSDSSAGLDLAATDIEAALDAALAAHAEAAFDGAVVVSDGLENVGDAARALRTAREAGLPLHWVAVGRPPPRAHIAEVLAPLHAVPGQRIQVTVQLAGQMAPPLRIKATARGTGGETRVTSRDAAGAPQVTLELDTGRSGAVVVDVVLEDAATGQTLDALPDAAAIDVAPRATLLYARGSPGPLARSLVDGGWAVDVIPAARLDAHADGLDGYRALVLDDVAISDASPRLWAALVAAVRERGLGLLVLGGERSFAGGGYRESTLESVLPVLSEPPVLDQPASIVFVVDKSGSMGQGSGGVDRFALAQRAVLETARGLGERDALGLVVFDIAPRLLIPLGPAAAGTQALARDWPVRPNGGTRLAPAFELAIAELERSPSARRMLVVVTDGFIDKVPRDELRARLARSRIETLALAVGPDADAGALQGLIGVHAGPVLRVDQAAELPFVMRTGLERRRARVQRGTIAVEQPLALPFAPGLFAHWPSVGAHAVTRPQAQALVAVQSESGEPLIAWHQAGRGRVLAVTSGLGPWAPQWSRWREWPRLAGGLAEWVSGTPPGGAGGLTVLDLPGALQIEADIPAAVAGAAAGKAAADGVAIAVNTPTTAGRQLATDTIAPGRLRALLPDDGPGLYTFLVSTPLGTQRQLHLRRQHAESQGWGINPALQAWQSAGLVQPWAPGFLAQRSAGDRVRRPVDRVWLGLGLLLFLAGVGVDRTRLDVAGAAATLRRWRVRG